MRAWAGFLFSHLVKHNYLCCQPLALQIGPVGLWLGIWPRSSKSIGPIARQRVQNANDLIIKHAATRVNTNWPRRASVSVKADGSGSPSDKAWETITKYVEGKNVEDIWWEACRSSGGSNSQLFLSCTKNMRKAKPLILLFAAFCLSKSFSF